MSAISSQALEFARSALTRGKAATDVSYEHSIQPTFDSQTAASSEGTDWLTRRRNAGAAVASLMSGTTSVAGTLSTRWSQSVATRNRCCTKDGGGGVVSANTIGGDELLFAPASYARVAAQVEGYADDRKRDAVTVYDLMRDAFPNYWKGGDIMAPPTKNIPDSMRVANAVLLTHSSMASKFKNPEGDVFAAERTQAVQTLMNTATPGPAPSITDRMSFADAMNATHAALVQMGAGVNHRQSDVFNYMMKHNLGFRDFVRWMGQDPVRHRQSDYDDGTTTATNKRRRIEADATCEIIKRYEDGTFETVESAPSTSDDMKQYSIPLEWFMDEPTPAPPPPPPLPEEEEDEEDEDFDMAEALREWGGAASPIPVVSAVRREEEEVDAGTEKREVVSVKNVFETRGCSRWRARVERTVTYFATRHGVDVMSRFYDIVRTKQSSSEADTHRKPMLRLAVGANTPIKNTAGDENIACIDDAELEKVVILAMMDLDRGNTDTPIAFPKSHYAGEIAVAILERFAFRLQIMQDGNRPLALMSDCVHVQVLTNHIVTVTLPALCAQDRVRNHECRFIRNVEVTRAHYRRRCTKGMEREIEDEMQRSVRILRESDASEEAMVRGAVRRSDNKGVPINVGPASMSLLEVVRYVAPDNSAIAMCFKPMDGTDTEVLACMELMAKHKDATTPIILEMIKVLVPLVLSDDMSECKRAVDVFISSIPGDDVFFTAWKWVSTKCEHPSDFKQGISACRAFDLLRVARTRHAFLKNAGFMIGAT